MSYKLGKEGGKMGKILSDEQKEKYTKLLSENLAMLRAKAGITQEKLSNLLGISRQTYSAMESQGKAISWNTYLSLIFIYDNIPETRAVMHKLDIISSDLISNLSRSDTKDT